MKISKLLKHLSLVLLLGVTFIQAKKIENKKIMEEKVIKVDKNHEVKHEIFIDEDMVKVLYHIKKDLRESGRVLDEVCKGLEKEKHVISHDKALRLMVELKEMKMNLDKDSKEKIKKFEDIVNDAKEDTVTRRNKNKSYCNISVRNALCANLVRANCLNSNSLRVFGNSNVGNTAVAPGSTLNLTGVNVVGLPEPAAPTSRVLWAIVNYVTTGNGGSSVNLSKNFGISNVSLSYPTSGRAEITLTYDSPFISEPSVSANVSDEDSIPVIIDENSNQNKAIINFKSGGEGKLYVQIIGPVA